MPEPVIDSEKNACPIAEIQTIGSDSLVKSAPKRNAYPPAAPCSVATLTAKIANSTKNSGIIILFVFSMLLAPKNSVSNVPATIMQ